MSDVQISLELVTEAFTKALNQSAQQTKQFSTQVQSGMGKATGAWDVFVGSVASQALVKALSLASDAAKELFHLFVTEGIAAASAQEVATNKLNTALAISGKYTQAVSKDLQEYAGHIQATTKYSDDAVISNLALLSSLTGLSGDGLKKAQTAALDLSAALGVDLESATTLVGKAANGEVGAFGRYGIVMQEGKTNAETFANALQTLSSKFGGSAAAQAGTYSGILTQISNKFEDMQKVVGFAIIQNPVLLEVLNQMSQVFSEMGTALESNSGAIKSFVSDGIILAVNATQGLIWTIDLFARVGSLAFNGIKLSVLSFAVATSTALELVGLSSKETTDILKEQWVSTSESIDQAVSGTSALSNNLKTAYDFMGNLAVKAEEVKNATVQDKTIANNKDAVDPRIEQESRVNGSLILQRQAHIDNLALIEQQGALTLETISDGNEARTLAKRQEFERQQLQITTNADIAKAMLESNSKTRNEQLQTIADKNAIDRAKLRAKQEEEIAKNKVANQRDTFATIATLSSSSNKTLASIGKAAAITQIAIDTPVAIGKAMAAFPPPFNFAAAGLVGVAMAAQAAQIAGVQFADGGIVPGSSNSGDRIRASLNSGEMVLNRNQQATLFRIANQGGANAGSDNSRVEALLSKLIDTVKSSSSISIDGREIINVVRDGLNSGRSLA